MIIRDSLSWRFRFLVIALFLVFANASFAQQDTRSSAQPSQETIGGRADRTPAEQKLHPQLMFAVRAVVAGAQPSQIPYSMQSGVQSFIEKNVGTDQTIFVVIRAKVTPGLVTALQTVGAYDISEFPQYETITARLPISVISEIAARSDVNAIGPQEIHETHRYILSADELKARLKAAQGATTNVGNVTWEGVIAHKANLSQNGGILGSGVKVCVISDGVDSLASRQASGDLGTVTVLAGQAGSGDEGTAMLEIVHDMAPNATLAFATANPSTAQFATNIVNLRNAGCDIIVDDISYFNEGVFQDGPVAQAVNTVTTSGALYFSSAANSGNLTHGTSGTYEGDFVPSAAAVPAAISAAEGGASVTLHSFNGTPYTTLTQATSAVTLHWSDPLGGSSNDYDIFVMDSTGSQILGTPGYATQSGSQDPFEISSCNGCTFPAGARIYIVKYSGAVRAMHLDTHRGRISNGTTGSTYGHNAAGSALTVAAVDVRTANGGAFVGGTANPVTYYSSDGPRKIFYTPAGAAITSGNVLFASSGGTTLQKTDLAASDCGSTTTPDFSPFCGTSAAAPTAAAIAALIKSANPGFTKAQITTALLNSALDIEAGGIDRDSGVGIVMAPSAAPAPDLIITSMTAASSAQSGAAVTGAVTVMNQGNASAGASRLKFYVSSDNVITTSDTNTGYYCDVPVLAAGASYNCSGTISQLSLAPGSYYFGAIADADAAVAESNENNNNRAAAAPTQITVAGTLPSAPTIGTATAGDASASVAFTPGSIGSGTLINYTADCGGVTNTGSSSPIVVSGLTNGTSYTCKVKTTSTVGDSPWSASSNAVTPTAGSNAGTWAWIQRTSNTSVNLNGIIYAAGKFVAVGDGGTILTSADGVSWTARSSGVGINLGLITYGNGRFVVPGGDHNVLTSADGVTWINNSVSWFAGAGPSGITYGNGLFVAVSTPRAIYASTDGVNWYYVSDGGMPGSINPWYSVAYGNGHFVAVGPTGTITSSSNGINWTLQSYNTVVSEQLYSVVYGPTLGFMVTGAAMDVLTSSDGTSWTLRSHSTQYSGTVLYGLAYGNGYYMFTTGLPAQTWITQDGQHFPTDSSWPGGYGAAAYGNGRFVMVGGRGFIASGQILGVPSAPTITGATPGRGSVILNFTPPANDGGSAITQYTATCTASGQTTRTATAAGSPLTVTGLKGGVTYSCVVTAVNGSGIGPSSTASLVTPLASANITPILSILLSD